MGLQITSQSKLVTAHSAHTYLHVAPAMFIMLAVNPPKSASVY